MFCHDTVATVKSAVTDSKNVNRVSRGESIPLINKVNIDMIRKSVDADKGMIALDSIIALCDGLISSYGFAAVELISDRVLASAYIAKVTSTTASVITSGEIFANKLPEGIIASDDPNDALHILAIRYSIYG